MADKPKIAQYPQIRLSDSFVVARFQEFCDRTGRKYCKAGDEALKDFLLKNDPTFEDMSGVVVVDKPERRKKAK